MWNRIHSNIDKKRHVSVACYAYMTRALSREILLLTKKNIIILKSSIVTVYPKCPSYKINITTLTNSIIIKYLISCSNNLIVTGLIITGPIYTLHQEHSYSLCSTPQKVSKGT